MKRLLLLSLAPLLLCAQSIIGPPGLVGVTINGSGSGSGAPTDAQYLTLATNATLSVERVLTPGTCLSAADAGAGSTYTLNVTSTCYDGVLASLAGNQDFQQNNRFNSSGTEAGLETPPAAVPSSLNSGSWGCELTVTCYFHDGTVLVAIAGVSGTATARPSNSTNGDAVIWSGTNFRQTSAGYAPVGIATTNTFTNKTYDAEGTGNVLTIPVKIWLPSGGCQNATAVSFWDLPTSTPAVAACITGTNTQKGVLDFADTSGGFSAQNEIMLPADFSGTVDAVIIWLTSATSGNAKWSLSTICTATAATETDDPAFNTASTVTTAAPGTTLRLQSSAITSLTITGCAASEYMHLKIFRDGNDAADTIAATARLVGIELTVRRAI